MGGVGREGNWQPMKLLGDGKPVVEFGENAEHPYFGQRQTM